MVSRYFSMKLLKYVRAKGYNFKTFIIVGANKSSEKIRKVLAKDLTFGYRFLGFFDEINSSQDVDSDLIVGKFEDVEKFAVDKRIDEMYVALHIDNIEIINELTRICEQNMIRIKFIPDFQLYTKASKVEVAFYENTPVLMFRPEPLEFASNRLLKKAFDICFSSLVILLVFRGYSL